jgi:hypothetical protein
VRRALPWVTWSGGVFWTRLSGLGAGLAVVGLLPALGVSRPGVSLHADRRELDRAASGTATSGCR